MGAYRVGRQGNEVLRNCGRLQETEPNYTKLILGGRPRVGTLPPVEKPRPWV